MLSSHHYAQFQQQRIDELTATVERLRGERQQSGPLRYEAKVLDRADILPAIEDGYEVVAQFSDGQVVLRRPVSR